MQNTYEAKAIFDYLDEGIIILSKEKSVLYCNQSVITHFEENIQGKHISELMQDDLIKEYNDDDAGGNLKVSFKIKSGKIFTTKCRMIQDVYLGQHATVIIIQKYDYAEVDWEIARSILDKMPYMIMIEEYKRDYVYLNNVAKWLMKNITGHSVVGKDAAVTVNGKIWEKHIAKRQWDKDNEVIEKQNGLYAERSVTANGQMYNYSLSKWGIRNKKNELDKIVTIGTADLYTRKFIGNNNEAHKEKAIKSRNHEVFNSKFIASMLGAESVHTCIYDEEKRRLKILSEIEEDFEEDERINDVYMTADEYRKFACIEENYSVEEFEQVLHCVVPMKWRSQGIKWVKKCPLKLGSEILGIIIITFRNYIDVNFPARQVLIHLCNDIASIVKNLQLTECIRKEFESRQAIEEDLKVCLDIAMDSCIICDKDLNVIKIGDNGGNVLGLSSEKMHGKNIMEIIHPEMKESVHKAKRKFEQSNKIEEGIGEFTLVSGEKKWLEWRARYIGEKGLFFFVIRDITEQRNKEIERRDYKDTLRMESLKNAFIANVSHELKTPVNIIYSMLQLIELEISDIEKNIDGEVEKLDKLRKYREISRKNVYRLLRMINNISDATEIDAGSYQLKLENYNIVEAVREMTQIVAQYMKNRPMEMMFESSEQEVIMAVDITKLERIIFNILSNAIKFSSHEGIIKTLLRKEGETVVIEVKDNGIGIPSYKQSIIFEKFTQLDSSFTRKCEGSGIGLAIVKKFVEVLNGTVSVESNEGIGSTFKITLPIHRLEGKEVKVYDQSKQRVLNCSIELSDIFDA